MPDGVSGEALGGLLEAVFRRLGASSGPLGPVVAFLGGPQSECRFVFSIFGVSWGRLGRLLGVFWAVLGPSWADLEGPMGRFVAIFGVSWAVLERRELEKARRQAAVQHPETLCFRSLGPLLGGLLGLSWGVLEAFGRLGSASLASWSTMEPSWRPHWLSWAFLGAFMARLGCLASGNVTRGSPRAQYKAWFWKGVRPPKDNVESTELRELLRT